MLPPKIRQSILNNLKIQIFLFSSGLPNPSLHSKCSIFTLVNKYMIRLSMILKQHQNDYKEMSAFVFYMYCKLKNETGHGQ